MMDKLIAKLHTNSPSIRAHRVLPLAALFALALPGIAHADAVTLWNANAGEAAQAACISPANDPLHESRLYAMLHLAIHDALNAIDRRARPYAYDTGAPEGASIDAAVAAAARDILVSQLRLVGAPMPPTCATAGVTRAEADYAAAMNGIAEGPAKTQGVAVGQAAAAAVIARRAGDGSDTALVDPGFKQGKAPGEWRFTPDAPPVAFGPGWGRARPFVLQSDSQFRPGPPYNVSCSSKHAENGRGCGKYAVDFNEVKALGGARNSSRSADQTEIALFWVESSPLQWNRIARTLSASQSLDPWRNARLFALLNMGQADGYVASFATKYHYRFWRPTTAVREAANDDNPATSADPTWSSLSPTPPIPDYESAHAVQGAVAARVMERVLGDAPLGFSTCSLTLPAGGTCKDPKPTMRAYRSVGDAAAENGVSRIYVGFHFRDAVDKGLEHGRRIGDWAVDNALQSLH